MPKVETGFQPPESSSRRRQEKDCKDSVRVPDASENPNNSSPSELDQVNLIEDQARLQITAHPSRKVSKDQLVNKINYVNFQDANVLVVFKHKKYAKIRYIQAKPLPCVGEKLAAVWSEGQWRPSLCRSHRFDHVLVPAGNRLLRVDAELLHFDNEGFALQLPEYGLEVSARKVSRHRCQGIAVHLVQNSTVFPGTLLDFNAVSFRVLVHAIPPQTFQWLNPDRNISVIFSDGSQTLYTGECRVLSQSGGQKARDYVLEPIHSAIQRFKPKRYRSPRHRVVPSPDLVFQHPFTGKTLSLKVIDLCGSGFSVEEDTRSAVLLPGLMLPDVELSFGGSLRFKCRVQVIYRHDDETGDHRVRCGMVILDMDVAKHVHLVALLQQAENRHSYLCNKVDLDGLWDFFFETGFIYPHKYEFIHKNKEQIKTVYRKFYTQNPNIARHFVYQDKGRILAHMAMVRFYENTWLIHHHAARKSESNRAGLIVLKQIGDFCNDSHRLYSIHLDYAIFYYRPENKFPFRVFGGVARNIKNIKICSEELFAYLHFRIADQPVELGNSWEMVETHDDDLRELKLFYESESGGLMLQGLNLEPGNTGEPTLAAEYRKLGFRRRRSILSLKCNGDLKAVILFDTSEIGLNLSDLTNCIKLIVLDPRGLTRNLLQACFTRLIRQTGHKEMPVMVYPAEFAAEVGIPFEKQYNLWILDMQHIDEYFRYLNRLLRFVKK